MKKNIFSLDLKSLKLFNFKGINSNKKLEIKQNNLMTNSCRNGNLYGNPKFNFCSFSRINIGNKLNENSKNTIFPNSSKLIFKKQGPYKMCKHFSSNNNENKQNSNNNENENKYNKKEENKDTEDDIDSGARKMFYVFTTVSAIMVCVYYGVSLMSESQKIEQIKRSGKVIYVGKAKIGGPWKMIDTNGKPFGSKDLEGKYYLIYFGFTKCPDVCPMSMTKIAQTLKYLKGKGLNNNFDIEAVFVSCDPDRDNLDKIKAYCEVFSKDIIGVTASSNNDETLTKMLKDFKIHASKIYLSKEDKEKEEESLAKLIGKNNFNQLENIPTASKNTGNISQSDNSQNYSLDHTIVTYLMGPKNQFVTYLGGNLSYKEMSDICFEEILNDMDTRRTL